jgi:polyhydroxyalkanoate synthesis regulator phasin
MPQTPKLNKYLDAGTEFVALTRAQARERAQELVQQGQLSKNQVQGFVDGLVEESRRRTDFLMETVRQEIQRQVQAVGIATKDDLVKLEAKLAKQSKAGTKSAVKSAGKSGKKAGKKAGKKKAAGTAKSPTSKSATKRASGAKKKAKKAPSSSRATGAAAS